MNMRTENTSGLDVFATHRRERGVIGARELVISVIVLIVLIVVLVPVFRGSDPDQTRAASARNLMQWGIALNLYMIEHRNRLPEVGGTRADPELEKAWYNALPLYISLLPLSDMAPETLLQTAVRSPWRDPGVEMRGNATAYFFNYGMNRYLQPDSEQESYRIFAVENPGGTVFMTEVAGTDPGVVPVNVDYRHGSRDMPKANVLFCDGHVRLVERPRLEEEFAGANPGKPDSIWWSPFDGAPEPVLD